MATLEFPITVDFGVYSFRVELEAVEFNFDFRFNPRDNHWYFDLLDSESVAIRHGLKVVSNWPLLRTLIQQGRPDGEIVSVNPTDDDDPRREDFGVESVLAYLEGVQIG